MPFPALFVPRTLQITMERTDFIVVSILSGADGLGTTLAARSLIVNGLVKIYEKGDNLAEFMRLKVFDKLYNAVRFQDRRWSQFRHSTK